jgi:hypothetical protein
MVTHESIWDRKYFTPRLTLLMADDIKVLGEAAKDIAISITECHFLNEVSSYLIDKR